MSTHNPPDPKLQLVKRESSPLRTEAKESSVRFPSPKPNQLDLIDDIQEHRPNPTRSRFDLAKSGKRGKNY